MKQIEGQLSLFDNVKLELPPIPKEKYKGIKGISQIVYELKQYTVTAYRKPGDKLERFNCVMNGAYFQDFWGGGWLYSIKEIESYEEAKVIITKEMSKGFWGKGKPFISENGNINPCPWTEKCRTYKIGCQGVSWWCGKEGICYGNDHRKFDT